MNQELGTNRESKSKGLYFIIFLLLLLILILGWDKLRSITRFAPTKLELEHVFLDIEIADGPQEQIKGLSGRNSLCETCGMLFVYKEPQIREFWMKGMKFPLDMIFIRDGKVVEIAENAPALVPGFPIPKMRSQVEADMVLEVNAGFAAKAGIKVGDPLLYP